MMLRYIVKINIQNNSFLHTESVAEWTRTSVHKVISSWKDKNKIWDKILSFKI